MNSFFSGRICVHRYAFTAKEVYFSKFFLFFPFLRTMFFLWHWDQGSSDICHMPVAWFKREMFRYKVCIVSVEHEGFIPFACRPYLGKSVLHELPQSWAVGPHGCAGGEQASCHISESEAEEHQTWLIFRSFRTGEVLQMIPSFTYMNRMSDPWSYLSAVISSFERLPHSFLRNPGNVFCLEGGFVSTWVVLFKFLNLTLGIRY